jgi:hypothetical protein
MGDLPPSYACAGDAPTASAPRLTLRRRQILPTKGAFRPTGTKSPLAAFMMMNTSDSEGLGLSVLVYLGAVLSALALLAVPAYYATRAEIHQNPVLAQSDPLLNGTVITDRLASRFPLEMLQRQNLAAVDPVLLKPKMAKKAEPAPSVAARPARRDSGTPVAQLQTERNRQGLFPFSLF